MEDVVNANVFISVGPSFDSSSMAEIELEKEGGVYVLNPNKAFVTIVAHESNESANFKLSASYKPRDVASLTEEDKGVQVEIIRGLYTERVIVV